MKIKVKRYKEIERAALAEAIQRLLREQPREVKAMVQKAEDLLALLIAQGFDEKHAAAIDASIKAGLGAAAGVTPPPPEGALTA